MLAYFILHLLRQATWNPLSLVVGQLMLYNRISDCVKWPDDADCRPDEYYSHGWIESQGGTKEPTGESLFEESLLWGNLKEVDSSLLAKCSSLTARASIPRMWRTPSSPNNERSHELPLTSGLSLQFPLRTLQIWRWLITCPVNDSLFLKTTVVKLKWMRLKLSSDHCWTIRESLSQSHILVFWTFSLLIKNTELYFLYLEVNRVRW